jgi:hypothetical protein
MKQLQLRSLKTSRSFYPLTTGRYCRPGKLLLLILLLLAAAPRPAQAQDELKAPGRHGNEASCRPRFT